MGEKDNKVLENKDSQVVETQPKRRGRPPKKENSKAIVKDEIKEKIVDEVKEKIIEEKIEVKPEISSKEELKDTIKDAFKEVVDAVKESSVESSEVNPRKRKTVRFEQHEEVLVTSLVKRGILVFEDHEGIVYEWLNYGDENWLSIKALYHMRNRHKGFFTKPLVMVDEDVAKFLKVDTMYQDLIDTDNMEKVFNLSSEDLREELMGYPIGIKEIVVDMAIKMVKDGTLDSMKKIRIIEEVCKVELSEQSDRSFIIDKKKK